MVKDAIIVFLTETEVGIILRLGSAVPCPVFSDQMKFVLELFLMGDC